MIITSECYEDDIKYDGRSNNNQGYSVSYKLNSFKGIPNKIRVRKMFINYIIRGFYLCDIYSVEEQFTYDETEEFVEKHEFDYDENSNLNYTFSMDDLGKDVNVSLLVFIDDPSKFYDYVF